MGVCSRHISFSNCLHSPSVDPGSLKVQKIICGIKRQLHTVFVKTDSQFCSLPKLYMSEKDFDGNEINTVSWKTIITLGIQTGLGLQPGTWRERWKYSRPESTVSSRRTRDHLPLAKQGKTEALDDVYLQIHSNQAVLSWPWDASLQLPLVHEMSDWSGLLRSW